jgi:hypothetical protein
LYDTAEKREIGEPAMRLPRYHFTIRSLLLLVAGCAVVLAMIRSPFGFLVVAFGAVIPGFALERAKGGDGILGGALSACLCAGGLAIVVFSRAYYHLDLGDAIVQFIAFLFCVLLVAFVCGAILSSMLYAIFALIQTLMESPLRDDSCGPSWWHRLSDGPVERE